MNVFISYSTKDKVVADDVCSALENSGIKCWIAPRNIQPGTPYASAIIDGITSAKIFLLVMTPGSNDSEHVISEVHTAFKEKKTIIPFFAEDVALNRELNYYLSRIQRFIAYPNYNSHLDDLVVAIADNLKLDIAKPYIINGHEYVDLGLPSGLKWATCNVGATKSEEFGDYYAWGELKVKRDYSSYKRIRSFASFLVDSLVGCEFIGKDISNTKYDVAHVLWGSSWRMPTKEEQDELRNECNWTWITQNGVNGYKVLGSNGNSIFLPAAGCHNGAGVNLEGVLGSYWSASLDGDSSGFAYSLDLSSDNCGMDSCGRSFGRSVRPVSE